MPAHPPAAADPARECQLGAHRARWLVDGDCAYAAMLAQIGAADTQVCFEIYLLRPEGPAERVRAALLAARLRGVQVHVLYDAFGSEGLPGDFFAELVAAGADVRPFSPARRLRLAVRDHRKLLVCDRRVAIVGGMNVASEYAGDGVRHGWLDLALQIEGPVAGQLADSFAALQVLAPMNPRAIRAFRRAVRALHAHGTARTGVIVGALTEAVALLMSGPGWPPGRLRAALRADLDQAHEVRCMAAYFLPPTGIRRALRRCNARGGQVQLLLAGPTDVPVARFASEHLYARLLAGGSRLYEYQPQVMHAKLLVLDDVVYVGSCNLDRRSLNINYELLLRLAWPELAAQARTLFARSLEHSRALTPAHWRARRHWWQRWRSRAAYWLLTRVDPLLARRSLRALS